MRKIAFFLGQIHGTGGISRVTWIVASSLKDFFDVSVLGCSKSNNKYNYPEEVSTAFLFDEVKPVHKRFFETVKRIRKYVIKNDVDIFVCAGSIFFPAAVLALTGLNTKLICWEHSNFSVTTDHKFQRICRLIGAKFSDKVVVLTKADQKMFKNAFKINNCDYIYNPVDDRLVTDVKYDVESKKIISVGRLCYQKNFERLVDIAQVVLSEHPDWLWHIYGDGENRGIIEKKISDAKLEDKLVLKGNVPDLYSKYKEYSFLVMTSRFEGFPMTLLESTASGIPSIAFDVLTGPNEIIQNEVTGFLVDKESNEEMINKINKLIESETLRKQYSFNCLKHREKYECSNITKCWIELLNSI